jgi:hypothetical protein
MATTVDSPTSSATPALEVIRLLSEEIGPRRPCSEREAEAARRLAEWLREHGVQAHTESFDSYASFGYPIGAVLAASLLGGALQATKGGPAASRRARRLGDALALAGLAGLVLEADLRLTPVSDQFAKRPSTNVVASVAAAGELRQRVCLCAHTDTTRSGLIFHPRAARRLPLLLQTPVAGALTLAAGPLLRRLPGGKTVHRAGIAAVAFGVFLLLERELRGEDVAGANDNASGCGVVAQLAGECAGRPLRHTQVDVLVSGSEEVGLRGARAYVRNHRDDPMPTIYVNFDTVGGDVPLTYVMREGTPVGRPASPRLVRLVEEIARRRPELALRPAKGTPGLPTDATMALVHGLEAITFLAQGETVPHYHWPTDTYENVEPRTVAGALETGRELLAALDAARG